MRKKTVQFLFLGECFKLPPFLSIIDALKHDFSIKILCYETQNNYVKLCQRYIGYDVTFDNAAIRFSGKMKFQVRLTNKLKRELKLETAFHKKAKEVIGENQFDKLWIIHEKTLFEVRDLLQNQKYIVSMYELMDALGGFLSTIKKTLQNASHILVCESNRASIIRTWMQLSYAPTVLPNKPYEHPCNRNIPLNKDYGFGRNKIILYQGHIQESRKIDAFCKAISTMKGFTLVAMGPKNSYRDKLEKEYPLVKFVDFINPPEHLYVTSHAYIGIVKYDFIDLNNIFCAPNKTYEYAGFGIPMIANNVPGLIYSVGAFKAAECIDGDNVIEIQKAIRKIDENYEFYSKNARFFYDSVDVKATLLEVLKD